MEHEDQIVEVKFKLPKSVLKWLLELLLGIKGRHRRVSFGYKLGPITQKQKEHKMPLEITITNEQQVNVTLKPVTATGKPAKLDGSPAWTVLSGNSRVVVSEDGLSADLVSADDPGDTEIIVKADADLGDGVEEVSDTIRLSVTGANAASLGLVAGTPTAKPTA